jgi:hypothetical protein
MKMLSLTQNLKSELNRLQLSYSGMFRVVKANLSNITKLLAGFGVSFVLYKTVVIYLNQRKYRHIPGPPINGFNNNLFFYSSCIESNLTFFFIKDSRILLR